MFIVHVGVIVEDGGERIIPEILAVPTVHGVGVHPAVALPPRQGFGSVGVDVLGDVGVEEVV